MIDDIIAALVLAVILGGAVAYIVRAKKKGVKCIGCPDGAKCGEIVPDAPATAAALINKRKCPGLSGTFCCFFGRMWYDKPI